MSKKKVSVPQKGVTVFTMNYCPYCERAKKLLKSRGVEYAEVKIDDDDDDSWDELFKLSQMKTMPQIFSGSELIGGFNELNELDQKTSLVQLKS